MERGTRGDITREGLPVDGSRGDRGGTPAYTTPGAYAHSAPVVAHTAAEAAGEEKETRG